MLLIDLRISESLIANLLTARKAKPCGILLGVVSTDKSLNQLIFVVIVYRDQVCAAGQTVFLEKAKK